jgi:hypothetical protein
VLFDGSACASGEAQQHGKKGEQADENEQGPIIRTASLSSLIVSSHMR